MTEADDETAPITPVRSQAGQLTRQTDAIAERGLGLLARAAPTLRFPDGVSLGRVNFVPASTDILDLYPREELAVEAQGMVQVALGTRAVLDIWGCDEVDVSPEVASRLSGMELAGLRLCCQGGCERFGAFIARCPSLQALWLATNAAGMLAALEPGTLSELRLLSLYEIAPRGGLTEDVCRRSLRGPLRLEALEVSGDVSADFLRGLNLGSLRRLCIIDSEQIDDASARVIAGETMLTHLHLSPSTLTAEGMRTLVMMPSLRHLYVRYCPSVDPDGGLRAALRLRPELEVLEEDFDYQTKWGDHGLVQGFVLRGPDAPICPVCLDHLPKWPVREHAFYSSIDEWWSAVAPGIARHVERTKARVQRTGSRWPIPREDHFDFRRTPDIFRELVALGESERASGLLNWLDTRTGLAPNTPASARGRGNTDAASDEGGESFAPNEPT